MKCSVDVLIYLTDLYNGVPHHTPQRYKFIHSLLADAFHSLRESYVVDVPGFDVDDGRTLKTMDDITPDFIAAYNEHAHKLKLKFTPNKCHFFMPSELFCCGKSIKMNVRYATVKVYHVAIQYAKGSKLCINHLESDDDNIYDSTIDIRPLTRAYAKEIDEKVSSGEGFKKDENIERYYERTAGMFYFFCPC